MIILFLSPETDALIDATIFFIAEMQQTTI